MLVDGDEANFESQKRVRRRQNEMKPFPLFNTSSKVAKVCKEWRENGGN